MVQKEAALSDRIRFCRTGFTDACTGYAAAAFDDLNFPVSKIGQFRFSIQLLFIHFMHFHLYLPITATCEKHTNQLSRLISRT